jgi:hypothetical protein
MKVGKNLESYLVFGNLHEHICLNRYGKFSNLGFTFTFNKVQPKEPQVCKKIHMFGSKMWPSNWGIKINIQSWAHGFYPLTKKSPKNEVLVCLHGVILTIKFTMKKEHSWNNNMFQSSHCPIVVLSKYVHIKNVKKRTKEERARRKRRGKCWQVLNQI